MIKELEPSINRIGEKMNVEKILQILEEAFPDRIVIARLSDYDQGRQHGRLEIIRYIKQLLEEKD